MRTAALVLALVVTALSVAPLQAQVLEWARCYDGLGDDDTALAVAVDSAGHVYVTGASRPDGGNPDYATVKYDAEGDSLWVRRYNSPSGEFDLGRDVLPDGQGNVYVTGSPVTEKYGPDGELLWSYEDFAHYLRLALGRDGNLIAAGRGPEDFKAITLDPDGNLLWQALYNGPANNDDYGNDVALDSEGNVVVAGQSWGQTAPDDGTQWNYATVKYDGATGDTLWTRRYNGPALDTPSDFGWAVTVDAADNVYVSGWSDGTSESPECLTISYSPEGATRWERRYPATPSPAVAAVCYDLLHDRGFVYAAARGSVGDTLLKYDADGNLLWATVYPTQITFATNPPRLAADAEGNVYMTSTTNAAGGTRSDYVVVKHTPEGEQEWVFLYPGTGSGTSNNAYDLAVDADANVYVTGESIGGSDCPEPDFDYLTLKISQVSTDGEPGAPMGGQALRQNHPNPFSTTTTIPYVLAAPAFVRLTVHDVLGRLVRTLVDEPQTAGANAATLDASNLPSGVYAYRLEAGAFSETRRLVVRR